MKKLFILLTLFISSCTTTRYVYVVDDVYFSKARTQQQPYNRFRSPSPIRPPYFFWYNVPVMPQTRPYTAPRKFNLDTYRSEFAPPHPPVQEKKQEENKEIRQAPVRKFK